MGVTHHDEPEDALVVVMVMGGRGRRKHLLPITPSTLLIAAAGDCGGYTTAASDGSVYAVRGRHRGGGCSERAENRGGLYVGRGEIRRNHLPLKLFKGG